MTARVDETDLGGVRIGARVDVTADSVPGRTLTGFVREIQGGTSATFASSPPDNVGSSFDRATQLIPVRIAIADRPGLTLVPGMNATVKIHKD